MKASEALKITKKSEKDLKRYLAHIEAAAKKGHTMVGFDPFHFPLNPELIKRLKDLGYRIVYPMPSSTSTTYISWEQE